MLLASCCRIPQPFETLEHELLDIAQVPKVLWNDSASSSALAGRSSGPWPQRRREWRHFLGHVGANRRTSGIGGRTCSLISGARLSEDRVIAPKEVENITPTA